MKLWWVHNETMIATLMAYEATKDTTWWNLFEKVPPPLPSLPPLHDYDYSNCFYYSSYYYYSNHDFIITPWLYVHNAVGLDLH